MMIHIVTEKGGIFLKKGVSLRYMIEQDIPVIQTILADQQVTEMTDIPHPFPKDGAKRWVEFVNQAYLKGDCYPFAILYNGEFAGTIVINTINRGLSSAEIDYWLSRDYWRKGIATQAVALATQFAHKELGLKMLECLVLTRNEGSIKVLERNGFNKVEQFTLLNPYTQLGTKHLGESFCKLHQQLDG